MTKYKVECPKHGKQYKDYPGCLQCFKEKEEKRLKRHEKIHKRLAAQEKIRLIDVASIPTRYKECNFDNFVCNSQKQEENKRLCQKYVESFESIAKDGRCFIMCGRTGTGKTHLACSILQSLIHQKGILGKYINTIDAISDIRNSMFQRNSPSNADILKRFTRPELLVLDEIGLQFGSDMEKTILFQIINARYQEKKPLILISNFDMKNLAEFIGERTVDRLRENNGVFTVFDWDSHRI